MFTLNGLPRDRWPGQQLLTVTEGFAIRQKALRRLEQKDPAFFAVVQRVLAAQNAYYDVAHPDWKARGAVWFARISRLRRAVGRQMRASGRPR